MPASHSVSGDGGATVRGARHDRFGLNPCESETLRHHFLVAHAPRPSSPAAPGPAAMFLKALFRPGSTNAVPAAKPPPPPPRNNAPFGFVMNEEEGADEEEVVRTDG